MDRLSAPLLKNGSSPKSNASDPLKNHGDAASDLGDRVRMRADDPAIDCVPSLTFAPQRRSPLRRAKVADANQNGSGVIFSCR
jgi:hypothetical protein